MIHITNGKVVAVVTNGAYESIFKKQGWHPVGVKVAGNAKKEKSIPVEDVPVYKGGGFTSEEDFADDVNEVDEDAKFCQELEEKPISGWSKNEVKKYAEIKGIDISGTKNVNEAKEIIKASLAG